MPEAFVEVAEHLGVSYGKDNHEPSGHSQTFLMFQNAQSNKA